MVLLLRVFCVLGLLQILCLNNLNSEDGMTTDWRDSSKKGRKLGVTIR